MLDIIPVKCKSLNLLMVPWINNQIHWNSWVSVSSTGKVSDGWI